MSDVFDPRSVPSTPPPPRPEMDWWFGPESDLEGLTKKELEALAVLAAHERRRRA